MEFTTLDEYEKFVNETKDPICNDLLYLATAIAGEAGEIADKVKKLYRDKNGSHDENDDRELILEVGDTLWYLTALAIKLKVPMWSVAKSNEDKINRRIMMGTLYGDGDYR